MPDDPDRASPSQPGGRPEAAPPATPPSTAERVRAWLVTWVGMNVVWQLLIAAWDFWETIAGLVASAFAATAVEAVREQGFVAFRPEWGFYAPIARAPWRTLAETPPLVRIVWRRLTRRERVAGRFYTVPLELPEDQARAAAKRSLFTIGESISPNSYVVGYDEATRVALVHELLPRGSDE